MTQEDVDRLVAYFEQVFAGDGRIAFAVRLSGLHVPSASVLKSISGFSARSRSEMATHMVCVSLCIQSAALRGALKFVNAMSQSPIPQMSFATWEETEAWAIARLEEARLGVPSAG